MKIILKVFLVLIIAMMITIYYGNSTLILFENNNPSKSIGTTVNGSLIDGKRLPTKGNNFRPYSYLGTLLGRNTVHNKVRKVVVDTYKVIYDEYPDKRYVYGETSWPSGGNFKPHLTHQNGLSVDFMVPVKNNKDKKIYLPVSIFNKFGYGVEFNNNGFAEKFKIDFEAMSVHLYYLYSITSKEPGIEISRVIFDPELQPFLFDTQFGDVLKQNLNFSKRRSWVRHDEHYHVDFKVD